MIKKWQLASLALLIVGLAGCGQSGNGLDPAVNTPQEQSSESKTTDEELKATVEAMKKKPEPMADEEFEATQKELKEAEIISHYYFGNGDYADAGTFKRIRQIVLEHENPTEEQVTDLLNHAYEIAEGFVEPGETRPVVINISVYATEDHAKEGSQWIGLKSKNGPQDSPKIQLDDRQFNIEPPTEKLGLTEDERRAIFTELILTEDAGASEDELAAKHGITREELDDIADEGLMNSWPFPPQQ